MGKPQRKKMRNNRHTGLKLAAAAGLLILAVLLADYYKEQPEEIRKPAAAGKFYPAGQVELKQKVDSLMAEAGDKRIDPATKITGLLVPHAGYEFSGGVAAEAFREINNSRIKTAIIMGPSHQYPLKGIALTNATHFKTPLGLVKVSGLNKKLAKEKKFEVNNQAHAQEHAIENELPFLQETLKNFEIVPLLVGELDKEERKQAVELLTKYLDKNTVVIVSADLSHYHTYEEALNADIPCLLAIERLDTKVIEDCEIDAKSAVLMLVEIAKQQNHSAILLGYKNSGEVTGDKRSVVGYGAIAFYKANKQLTKEQQKQLLNIARQSMDEYVKGRKTVEVETKDADFMKLNGVFVSLTEGGQLRGSIGSIYPQDALIIGVRDNAINAATQDTRFKPVSAEELPSIEITISVLTYPEEIGVGEIAPFKDGIYLRNGMAGATYLPQVWKQLPTQEIFLNNLCEKAGLDANCWSDKNTKIYRYRAQVFSERGTEEMGLD